LFQITEGDKPVPSLRRRKLSSSSMVTINKKQKRFAGKESATSECGEAPVRGSPRPESYNYNSIRRWLRHIKDLSSLEKIFVPVNIGNYHWFLIVVSMDEKVITCYDSMERGASRCYFIDLIVAMLEDESICQNADEQFPKIPFDFVREDWKIVEKARCPFQVNDYDCGIFMLTYVDLLSLGLPLLFSQDDCVHIRRRFIQECIDFCKFDSNRMPIENTTVIQTDYDVGIVF
jgi:hypothetical protein